MRFTVKLFSLVSLLVLLTVSCSQNTSKEPRQSEISLSGTWVSEDNPIYPVLEFKGKSTVVITALLFPVATSYERDEEFIRVKCDQSDLLFEIVSNDSLIGSGFATGTWIRQ